MKLLLGSGLKELPGFKRVDYDKAVKPDFVMDLDGKRKWKFKDNSVEEIRAENLIEHLKNLDHFMEECYRILKPNGLLLILVPHGRNHSAYSDPDHIRFFFPESFIYWSRDTTGSDGRPVVRGKCDFRLEKVTSTVPPKVLEKFKTKKEKDLAMYHYWDVCTFIEARLRTVKPLREGKKGKYGIQEAKK